MEFFNQGKVIKLRSHLDKYLLADEDEETIRQSSSASSRRAHWTVETTKGSNHMIHLKSCFDKYLTASETPFLLGMTGKKVTQSSPNKLNDTVEWEPIRDGFQVRLRTKSGKFLRGNGGPLPWRNSVTHDAPHRSATSDWVLWDVEIVEVSEQVESVSSGYESQLSSLSSFSEDSNQKSPLWSSVITKFPRKSSAQLGMELFQNAKAVRLKGHHDKYLHACDDEESVSQDRSGSEKASRWMVEFITNSDSDDSTRTFIRLKSIYNKYLTASNSPFLLGMTGRKVTQTLPKRLDSSVEWEPFREAKTNQVRLKTRYGNFLRANGGVPPWRNSVTHDVPHRTSTQDWVLWDVDVLEIQIMNSPKSVPDSPSSFSSSFESPKLITPNLSKLQSRDSSLSLSHKADGRLIYFYIADEYGDVDESMEETSFTFKGNGVDELTHKLEEETGIESIIVCNRSLLDGNLHPLRLQLPPNNRTMHVVVVEASSKFAVAKNFSSSGLL
ncbi:hypothetical protein GIB67_032977 [Kingdonia uniflora]|uniref:DUF569 domain-containing protein n=1 Tax=Kingdonia uniflora TaxID=39325 RepID=A0A7J7MYD0_9MAGN|nr:hypothetical protein GIB67_032977 [Kingdonia uniflora]